MKKYIVTLGALTLLGAGCASGTPTPNTPQEALNPESSCDALMTLDEAKEITGLAYTKRDATSERLGQIIVTTCTYQDTSLNSNIKPISLLTRRAATAREAKIIFEQSKTAAYTDGQALSGVGEQGLWSKTFGQVSVLQGQTWLIVTAMNNQELATKFAKTIVPKLP